jgi:hypothetical protein
LDWEKNKMPVFRFKTHEEAQRSLWQKPGDPLIGPILRALWSVAAALAGDSVPPRGVFKFRSIEEANAHREAWLRERIERLRLQRGSARQQG